MTSRLLLAILFSHSVLAFTIGNIRVSKDDSIVSHTAIIRSSFTSARVNRRKFSYPRSAFHCAASAIAPYLLMTAAHCLKRSFPYKSNETREGLLNHVDITSTTDLMDNSNRMLTKYRIDDKHVLVHPHYSAEEVDASNVHESVDIALIFFPPGVASIGLTPLQLYGDHVSSLRRGLRHLNLAGFGDDRAASEDFFLNTDRLKILGSQNHQILLRHTRRHGMTFRDSGGPAYLEGENKIIQLGINSTTSSRIDRVMQVASFKNWIMEGAIQLGEDPNQIIWAHSPDLAGL